MSFVKGRGIIVLFLFIIFLTFWLIFWFWKNGSNGIENFDNPSGYYVVTWKQPAPSGNWPMNAMNYNIYVKNCGPYNPSGQGILPNCGPCTTTGLTLVDTVSASSGTIGSDGEKTFTWNFGEKNDRNWDNAYQIIVVPFLPGTSFQGSPACISNIFYKPGQVTFGSMVYENDNTTPLGAGYDLTLGFTIPFTTNYDVSSLTTSELGKLVEGMNNMFDFASKLGQLNVTIMNGGQKRFNTFDEFEIAKNPESCILRLSSLGVNFDKDRNLTISLAVQVPTSTSCYQTAPLQQYSSPSGLRSKAMLLPGDMVLFALNVPGTNNGLVPINTKTTYKVPGTGEIGAPQGLSIGPFVPTSGGSGGSSPSLPSFSSVLGGFTQQPSVVLSQWMGNGMSEAKNNNWNFYFCSNAGKLFASSPSPQKVYYEITSPSKPALSSIATSLKAIMISCPTNSSSPDFVGGNSSPSSRKTGGGGCTLI